jgi:hypothetical protein
MGGALEALHFLNTCVFLHPFSPVISRPKALVASAGYHYKHSCERNWCKTGGGGVM